jgi:hypothetical protein
MSLNGVTATLLRAPASFMLTMAQHFAFNLEA